MADDIRVWASLAGHPRLRKLERRLGVHEARSVLVFLWLRARLDRPDGELRGWSSEDVAIACDWSGDPDKLVKDLTDCGWLDRGQDGHLSIHGWARRQGYAVGSRSREAINRTNAIKRWLYRAGFTKSAVRDMTPDEIEEAWISIGRPDGDANGCETDAKPMRTDASAGSRTDSQCDSQCPLPAPPPIPTPSPTPIPIPSPPPGVTGGGARAPDRPRHDLEAESLPIIAAWNDLAVQWPDAFEPIEPVHGPPPFTVRTEVARALLRPGVREDMQGVLEALGRRPPRYRQHGRLAITSLLSERNWSRYVSGELLGDGKPKGLREQVESDRESIEAILAAEAEGGSHGNG